VFAATYTDGVFKSTDGADSWVAVNGDGPLLPNSILALALSPNYSADQTVFAAASGRVFRTINGGQDWQSVGAGIPAGAQIMALRVSPAYASDHTLFIGGYQMGVYKSSDSGDSFAPIHTGLVDLNFYELAVSPAYGADHTLYGVSVNSGVYKSTNGGDSWTPANEGLEYAWGQSLALSPDYASSGTLYLGQTGIYRSDDRAGGWAALDERLWRRYAVALAAPPSGPYELFVATDGQGLWRYGAGSVATPTPTRTPTATATPTRTNSPTRTQTPGVPSLTPTILRVDLPLVRKR